MGIKLETITDPKLRAKIEAQLAKDATVKRFGLRVDHCNICQDGSDLYGQACTVCGRLPLERPCCEDLGGFPKPAPLDVGESSDTTAMTDQQRDILKANGWRQTSGPSGKTEWWHSERIGYRSPLEAKRLANQLLRADKQSGSGGVRQEPASKVATAVRSQAESESQRVATQRPIHISSRPPAPLVTDEIDQLHKPIAKWLREREWPFFYSNPTKRTHRTLGEPDFVILAPNSKMIFIECKTATGQLTKEQSALRARAAELGHYIWIVRNMEEFGEAVSKSLL